MFKPNTKLTIMLSVMGLGVSAQQSYSLQEAVNYAVKNNYQIQQANIDVAISNKKVKETTAIGLPQVKAEASFNDFLNIPVQVAPADAFGFPDWMNQALALSAIQNGIDIPDQDPNAISEFQFGQKFSASAGITASQLLFDGSYFVGLQAAKAYLNYAELGAERTASEVKTSVSKTYINVVAANENIKALSENKENIDVIYSETLMLFESGFIEKQNADQIRLLQSNVKNQLLFAKRQRKAVLNLLKFQMGVRITDSISLTDDIDALVELGSEDALVLMNEPFGVDNHIDYRTMAQGERLSELSLSNTRAGFYPQLSAFISHTENAYRNEFNFLEGGGSWYPTTLWGLQLNVPIFSSGMRYMQAQQSKLELAKIQSQKLQLEQSLNMAAINSSSNYRSALDRYETVSDDLELAKSIKETNQIKYNEGMASSTDITQAESQYLQTLGNYINTTIELLNAKLDLVTAYGK